MPELMDGTVISDREDQEEALGYDATHCEHGTFVGGWAGPDYMCHWCETGVTQADFLAIIRSSAHRRRRKAQARRLFHERMIPLALELGWTDWGTHLAFEKRFRRVLQWLG